MDFKQTLVNMIFFNEELLYEELFRFMLSFYKNSSLSRKAIDFMISQMNELLSNVLILFMQNQICRKVKNLLSDELYYQVQFLLYHCEKIFKKFSILNVKDLKFLKN